MAIPHNTLVGMGVEEVITQTRVEYGKLLEQVTSITLASPEGESLQEKYSKSDEFLGRMAGLFDVDEFPHLKKLKRALTYDQPEKQASIFGLYRQIQTALEHDKAALYLALSNGQEREEDKQVKWDLETVLATIALLKITTTDLKFNGGSDSGEDTGRYFLGLLEARLDFYA